MSLKLAAARLNNNTAQYTEQRYRLEDLRLFRDASLIDYKEYNLEECTAKLLEQLEPAPEVPVLPVNAGENEITENDVTLAHIGDRMRSFLAFQARKRHITLETLAIIIDNCPPGSTRREFWLAKCAQYRSIAYLQQWPKDEAIATANLYRSREDAVRLGDSYTWTEHQRQQLEDLTLPLIDPPSNWKWSYLGPLLLDVLDRSGPEEDIAVTIRRNSILAKLKIDGDDDRFLLFQLMSQVPELNEVIAEVIGRYWEDGCFDDAAGCVAEWLQSRRTWHV